MSEFDIVGPEAIREGVATDAYFERTADTLQHAGKNPRVVAEVTADQFPDGDYEVFAGVKDAAVLLSGYDVDVDAMHEGLLFDGGPVMRIEGDYLEFARLETSLLGFLSHASGCATASLEARMAAPDSTVFSFGARHVHPSIAAMVERSALVAGLDGFSHVAAGDILGKEASGTMPHALLIAFGRGNQAEAFQAFDESVPEGVPRVALCDTYGDEVEEVLRAVETLGDRLDSVRLDTTSSRRGDFRHIVREVRWELDARGYEDVGIFVSGGLGPTELRNLRDVVEGFGVGGYISNANPVDFALDIVEVDGEPAAKRGKLSGVKEVYRTDDGGHHIGLRGTPAPTDAESLLKPLIRDGELVRDFDLDAAATRAREDAERVGFGDE
ncbi:nicotinate phosphoribosyltransferase [Haloferax mediterranei ATCC 33500]|uniref:nicotinate phosphoribosyltransferase n=1 Tax=Haloferax mediterranei (strain ATCC 33500 / DSM 1411 / JCM 8866 / NBRC 14739 / NCIMB 2177 / R-4) TaxID=523841 RepID=I3R5T8_HALMT|nr:nicotinate phosphoribosyltransferase [Haloferax mediterranei]AFK19598.1 nicotinate phosphoribosyltransferase [Haloferax mediterranei ATCC 33500]AHZ22990.1 nicotinate phosphoribosyltransferase [Haloferax mediterranei ATCC 33500]ELZ99917.1 nicotinate phosphoribosyltransferase [Haloferax mediterranei ATCC 33500]MDX5987661.1 nicotinate phosphoribosyltransferase [Haloferax mediterranei ATCC 33500]QCQ74145.1 nicotinate phosphoribosyltransferase [Haloferax mediterranei ATCC 33500]